MPGSDPIDPPDTGTWPADPLERAAAAAAAGLRRPTEPGTAAALAGLVDADPDPRVRAAALAALARLPEPPASPEQTAVAAGPAAGAWARAATDPAPSVRRRAAELGPAFAGTVRAAAVVVGLLGLLADSDGGVAEAAAWALGEFGDAAVGAGAVAVLAEAAGSHGDALVREAAVAALGSLGDRGGLEAVLAACREKPAIRRRAVLALAAFEGPEVDAALRAALEDKDWQTRQAAEDLLA